MSIFSEQLRFKPLTPERRKYLRWEILAYLGCAALLVLGFFWSAHKPDIDAYFHQLFLPLSKPVGLWIKECVLPALEAMVQPLRLDPAVVSNIRYLGNCFARFVRETSAIVFMFFPPIVLILFHTGLLGFRRGQQSESILMTEIRKKLVLYFEPRLKIRYESASLFRDAVCVVILLLVASLITFLFSSGYIKFFLPGQMWWAVDSGLTNWMVASLRDARIAVPQEWMVYLHQQSMAYPVKQMTIYQLYLDPSLMFHRSALEPESLNLYKIFVGLVASLLMSIPMALSLFAAGVDRIFSRSFVLTPSRLMPYLTVFYVFNLNRTYHWKNLSSVKLEDDKFNLKFSNGRTMRIDSKLLNDEDRRTFLQALDELAPTCDLAPQVKAMIPQIGEKAAESYTLFWEDSLRSRRRSTVFAPLQQGSTLAEERLQIIRQLAGQGWSATYLARFRDQMVVVREAFLGQETEVQRRAAEILTRESKILAGLKHAGIATVLDHFVENERSYLVLEYIAGRDLRQHLNLAGRLPESEVMEIALKLCSILEYLHGQEEPIIHRDLSPDNLVIGSRSDIHLIDFGASKQFVETATGTMIGKQAFIAPEQLRGKATVRSDIYSLGATLFFLLTGEEPIALTECHPRQKCDSISVELDELISQLTQFEEKDRPQSAAEVRERLQYLMSNGYAKDSNRISVQVESAFRIMLGGLKNRSKEAVPIKNSGE